METNLTEVINSQYQKPDLQALLATYSHIELTEDELTQALIDAKRKKDGILQLERLREIEKANRERKREKFDFLSAKTFFVSRAKKMFNFDFTLDHDNEVIFDMLCHYFNDDATFVTMAAAYGVKNPSLDKGILFAGNFGVGKTVFMKVFMQNKRQSFFIRESKKIADSYITSKDKVIPEEYLMPFDNGFDNPAVFYQKYSGLCIDDIGAERVKNNFGNISNVIGELIEMRYSHVPLEGLPKLTGAMLHGSTNLSVEQLKDYYGERVTSRMREIFNWIVWKGEDRRK